MQKIITFLLSVFFVVSIQGQTPTPPVSPSGIKANLAAGEVLGVNTSENKISLQTSDGAIDVVLSSATNFKRVPPENPVITAAVASSLSEIGEKDKILVTGTVSADKKTITAKNVYLMSKSDIAKKLAAERELWKTKGISGKVVKVDFKTKEVTLSTRSMAGETNVVLSPTEKAEYFRYAPDSAKFSEAVPSNLAEIKVGDQVRALGDKSADGLTFKAIKYVTGSFKTVAGKITAIDIAKNEITIEDSATKKPTTIVVNNNSLLKRFPPEMAAMMARMMMGGGIQPPPGGQVTFSTTRPPQGGQPTTGNNPTPNVQPTNTTGQTPSNGASGNPNGGGQRPAGFGRGGGGGRNFELDDTLERLPALSINDLKVGETIGVSSTSGAVPNRFTAIKLVSGVEAFLSIPQMPAGVGRGSQQPTINIPGLDGGFGNP